MREDYHIYYENEEELSVWQPEIKMSELSETDEHTGQIRCPCHFTGFTHALSRYPF